MFAVKDKDQQKRAVASGAKSLDDRTNSAPQIREPVGSLRHLQRHLGNGYLQAVNPLISPMATDAGGIRLQRACACGSSCANCAAKGDDKQILQPKLTVGASNDRYEQEADRVADQIMRMSESTMQRQMKPDEKAEEIQTKPLVEMITPIVQRQKKEKGTQALQTKCEANAEAGQVQRSSDATVQSQPDLESRLNANRGGGSPLSDQVKSFMEQRFGADFRQVRVHTDNGAVQMNQELGAQAFTYKQDVYFGAGKAPGKDVLTAHELTHVVQQSGLLPFQQKPVSAPQKIQRPTDLREKASVQKSKAGTDHAIQERCAGDRITIQQTSVEMLQPYGHMNTCKQEDLENIIWPGDYLARQWLSEAIVVLNTQPLPSYVSSKWKCYFRTETPNLDKIKENLNKIQAVFQANDYLYRCNNSCEGTAENQMMGETRVSPIFGGSGPIILCTNNLRSQMKPDWIGARTILHEFAHRYLIFTGDTYCTGCCEEGLSPESALKNPDSYAGFVWDIHFDKEKAERKEKKKQ